LHRLALPGFYTAALTAACLASAAPFGGFLLAGGREPGVREEQIAELGPEVRGGEWELIATPDGARFAWREKRAGRHQVSLNGRRSGSDYDEVGGLQFNEDGKRLAFSARKGKQWTVVVDGVEQPGSFEKVHPVEFSPDGSRFEFVAKVKGGYAHVVDGKAGAAYKLVTRAEFSPDSRHVAYSAQKGKQWAVVEDGIEGPLFDETGYPRYEPKTQHLVHIGRRGKADFLSDAGKERELPEVKSGYGLAGFAPGTGEPLLEGYDGENSHILVGAVKGPLGPIRLRPIGCTDGCRHSVYATARIRNPTFGSERAFGQVVVDGKAGPEYEGAPVESTGKAFLRAMGGEQLRLTRGAFPGFALQQHGVSTPAVDRDFQHVAYAARRGNKDLTVVTDGVEGPKMDAIPCDPRYGPDGKLYYVGVENGIATLLADGKAMSEVQLDTPDWDEKGACIGPNITDGGHYVFGIVQKDGTHLVADGVESKLRVIQAIVGPKVQVENGRLHFAFTTWPDPKKPEALLVVDGKEGKAYADIWPITLRWTGDGVLTYIARDGQRLLRVTQTVP
jgi:hypothetical protein